MFKKKQKLVALHAMYAYERHTKPADFYGEFINFDDFIVPDALPDVDQTQGKPQPGKVRLMGMGMAIGMGVEMG